jgi:hypothetical protein
MVQAVRRYVTRLPAADQRHFLANRLYDDEVLVEDDAEPHSRRLVFFERPDLVFDIYGNRAKWWLSTTCIQMTTNCSMCA